MIPSTPSPSYIENTRERADLSTFAGQAAHYAGVRARLSARPLQVPAAPKQVKQPAPRPAPYGVPINLISPPSARNIVYLVALRHRVSADAITGPRRDRIIVAVRDEAIRIVHSRDHTTILHSLYKKARTI